MSDSTPARRLVALRIRALLAGGLVRGVGAAATLASWNDAEYAGGSFASSVFDTESSVQGSMYADNNSASGPVVTVSGAGYAPGVSTYFPVLIRTKPKSVAGSVVLNGATLSGTDALTLGAAFVYRVVRTAGTCDATTFTGSPVFVVGDSGTYRQLTEGQEQGLTNALAAATDSAPGAVTGFCFQVTLPDGVGNSLQGKAAAATWQFGATSN